MAESDLWSRLADARIDVTAEAARFSETTGDNDPDRFIAWLHAQRKISDRLFAELATGGGVSVARFMGVKEKTLLLEAPAKTLFLPSEQKTMLAGDVASGTSPGVVPSGERRQYTLLGCLGKGAMGEVHVARDEDLLRKVAYKKMVPEVAGSRALAARFFSEIQVTAQLDHPNIVPIYGLEVTSDGALGYSMKLVQGRTLAAVLEEAREGEESGKSLATRLEIFLKICDAMAYAHSKGVLHRDLKPENIMVGRYNEVYVMDWGICRVIGSDDPAADKLELATHAKAAPNDRTQYGAVLGTPAYMSPEQASGLNPDLDQRSDVYALGLILSEVITLKQAVTGATLETVLARATAGDKDTFVHALPGVRVARELRGIVARASAFAMNARYQSAGALADDLRRFLRGEAPLASPDSSLQKLARSLAHHRTLALGAMVLLVAIAAGGAISLLLHEQRALARARVREEAVQAFTTAVAVQSHAIDNHFHENESLLTGLAGRASELVSNPPSQASLAGATVYQNGEYDVEGDGPPDLTKSPYYGKSVSLGWTMVKLAPGVQRSSEAMLAAPLRGPMQSVLFGESEAEGRDEMAARKQVLETGGTFLRVFVTLESGIHITYPGMGGFAPDYDGRLRPKYKLAAHKKGVHWGNPYPDQFGHGLLLPMSAALYNDAGRFLGVCGADTTFELIEKELLELRGKPGVEDEYLVDEQGRVIVHGRQHGTQAAEVARAVLGSPEPDGTVALVTLPLPEVVAAVKRKEPGGVMTVGRRVLAYSRLASLGWYYVVAADEQKLIEAR